LLASSRKWIIDPKLSPEISWNYGVSISYDFLMKKSKNSFNIDFYRTQFVNQMVVDRDVSYQTIYFNNLKGQSFSNVLQTELNIALTKRFDYRLTYKLMDVEAELNQQVKQQLMVQKHRWLTNLSFKSLNKKWEANITGVLNGKMRLKMTEFSSGPKTFNTISSMYATVNAQITYIYKKWDFYIGGENLTN